MKFDCMLLIEWYEILVWRNSTNAATAMVNNFKQNYEKPFQVYCSNNTNYQCTIEKLQEISATVAKS